MPVARDLSHSENVMSSAILTHDRDQAADSCNLTRVRLPRCCGSVLADVGTEQPADSGGKLTFYGQDPIVRAASSSAPWPQSAWLPGALRWRRSGNRNRRRTGHSCHVRKALRRFSGFFEGKWETINGRSPLLLPRDNPFFELPLFRKTRDGRHVVFSTFTPGCRRRSLNFLRCH